MNAQAVAKVVEIWPGQSPGMFTYVVMVDIRLRAEILVMFKKGGRPQCSNGKYFRVRLYDTFI